MSYETERAGRFRLEGNVKPDFTAEEWAKLTILERIAKCDTFSKDAEGMGYYELAKLWRELAAEMAAYH